MIHWIDENKGMMTVSAIAALVLLTQFSSIKAKFAQNDRIAKSQSTALEMNQKLEAQKIVLENSRQIANDRYDTGCEVISTLAYKNVATVIAENQPIISGAFAEIYRKNPNLKFNPAHFIGRDITVCDLYGTTAITQFDAVKGFSTAQSIAVTNDRDRMKKAIAHNQNLLRPSFKGN